MRKLLHALFLTCFTGILLGQTILQPKGGGTGFGSYTTGNMLYASGSATFSKIAPGTNGQILSWSGGVPAWSLPGSVAWIPGGNTNGATKIFGTLDNFDLPIYTNNAEVARFKTNGTVGFGTTSPVFNFELTGNVNGSVGQSISNSNALGVSQFVLSETPGTGNAEYYEQRYNSGYSVAGKRNAIEFNNTKAGYMAWFTKNTERFRVDTNGYVGIGTSVPTTTLHVAGGLRYVDGNQGANKVLTSDASGNATWQAAGAGTIGGSGTLNFIPKFTPNGTTLGNSQIQDNGTIINIGSGGTSTSDPYVNILRRIDSTGASNAHGYVDASIYYRNTNGWAFNSFDAMPTIGNGASDIHNYNHYVPFQDAAFYNSTGTITNWYSSYSHPTFNRGTVTNRYGHYIDSWVQGGTATVTNDYGVYVNTLSGGTSAFAFYHNGTSPSNLGGQVTAQGFLSNGSGGNGFFELAPQSSAPSAPASNYLRMYSTSGNLSIKNNASQIMQVAFPGSGSYTYTMPAATTTVCGLSGSPSNNQIAYMSNSATGVTGSTDFTWNETSKQFVAGTTAYTNTATYAEFGGVTSQSGAVQVLGNYDSFNLGGGINFALQNQHVNGEEAIYISGTNSSNFAGIYRRNTSYSGTMPGSSIPEANNARFFNSTSGNFGDGIATIYGTPVYLVVGRTNTNAASKLDATGLRIDQLQNIHTANNAVLTVGAGSASVPNIIVNSQATSTVTTDGQIWNDNNQKAFATYIDGVVQYPVQAVYTQTTGITVGNTTVATTVLTSTAVPLPTLAAAKEIRIKLTGFHSATASPNITITVTLNGTTVLTTGAQASGNSTNAYCEINGIITCRTTGAPGTVSAQGLYQELGGGASAGLFPMVNTSTVSVNTATPTLNITAQWSVANPGNTLTFTDGYIEIVK